MAGKLVSRGAATAAMVAALALAAPAGAATIVLNNLGGVTPGSNAYQGFTAAANFWGSVITNNITINLDVGFGHLGQNILGETGHASAFVPTYLVEQQMIITGTSSVDATAAAHLPALSPDGTISMITPGYTHPDHTGVDTSTLVYDNNETANNFYLDAPTANLKALGFTLPDGAVDGTVIFSSDYNFDFNPSNGIAANGIDFIGTAIHEIGHALGFDSGVDIYDLIGSPHGPDATGHPDVCGVNCQDFPSEDSAFDTPLDLFRYSANLGGLGGPGPMLTWAPGVTSYFSIDGGATNLCNFATGQFNGDAYQASHWKRSASNPCGVMDPAVSYGQLDAVSNLDFVAFDAMGYNFTFDPGTHPRGYTTAQIYAEFGVPEPAGWALMLLGFGLAGSAVRRNRPRPLPA